MANNDYPNWYWTNTKVLTTTSMLDSDCADMAFDSSGNIHLVWSDKEDFGLLSGTDDDIWYMKWDATSELWGSLTLVSDISDTNSRISNIVVDDNDNLHILWTDNTDYLGSGSDSDLFYKNYNFNTDSWASVEVVTSNSTSITLDPKMQTDSSGNVHITYSDRTPYGSVGSDDDVFYQKRSSSTGLWGSPELISSGSDSSSNCPDLTITSNNIAHFVWSDSHEYFSSGIDTDLFHKKKNLNTGIWVPTITLLSHGSDQNSWYPSICSDSQDSVHIIWSDLIPSIDDTDIYDDLYYVSWDSVQNQWSTTPTILTDDSLRDASQSDICVNLFDNLHIIYSDRYLGWSTDRVFHKTKAVRLDEWSQPSCVSSESGDSGYPVFYSLTPDSKGYIHALWTDHSNYGGAGTDSDIFYRKFVGHPSSPMLLEIYPKSTTNKQVTLSWIDTFVATSYRIYRDTTFITDISSLTSVGSSPNTNFTDTVPSSNIYYYTIVAVSEYGESDISNVVSVEILAFFDDFDCNMFLFIGGALLVIQLIIAVIIYTLLSSKIKKSSTKKTSKKKKK